MKDASDDDADIFLESYDLNYTFKFTYKDLFIDYSITTDEQFLNGTTFEEIYALFCFDRNIRNIFLKYLLIIENNFKSIVSDVFSDKYGCDNYLILDNFNTSPNTSIKNLRRIAAKNKLNLSNPADNLEAIKISQTETISKVSDLFGKIQNEISRQLNKNNVCIKHYMTKYGYIPLWVLVNILTFGKISDFYLNMKQPDKVAIASIFNIQFAELHKAVEMLSIARNYCAHGNRFFNIRFKKNLGFDLYSKIHSRPTDFNNLGLQQFNGDYLQGARDLFAIVILFTQFLSKTDVKEFIRLFDNELNQLSKSLRTISIANVTHAMGFPANWKLVVKLC